MMTFLICIVDWWLIGVSGFVYWWTSEFDLTRDKIPMAFATGLFGPLAWLLGYSIHHESKAGDRIIIKKRKK